MHHAQIYNKALTLLVTILLLAGYGCASQTIPKAGIFELDDNTLLVKGVTARITPDYIIVQYSRRDHIRLETSQDMLLRGFPSIWAIENDQPVKIEYIVRNDRNIIISVTKLPRLGC